jgi:hypothetical protein
MIVNSGQLIRTRRYVPLYIFYSTIYEAWSSYALLRVVRVDGISVVESWRMASRDDKIR